MLVWNQAHLLHASHHYERHHNVHRRHTSQCMIRLGQRSEGLLAAEDAVGLLRAQVARGTDRSKARLAYGLIVLSYCYIGAGDHSKSLRPIEEALTLDPTMTQAQTVGELYMAGEVFGAYAYSLARADRPRDALQASRTSVLMLQRLARLSRSFEGKYAQSLMNYAADLADNHHWSEAIARSTEAVTIHRRLVEHNPLKYSTELARTLSNLAHQLAGAGRHDEALIADEEAVELHRGAAERDPDVFLLDLARTLYQQARRLKQSGDRKREQAVTAEFKQVVMRMGGLKDNAAGRSRIRARLHEAR
jgi:tetratricopeptide (TPR) repeat protein